ncbi:MAG: hypothetical protein HYY26_03885 [Acidobacteria bacterium]|nr:hypothetical protein [Acidobacteriota bacterium]
MSDIDRKYRQRGYMESYREGKGEKKKKPQKPPAPAGPKWQKVQATGPRAPQMPGTKAVSRCANCGAELALLLDELAQCPKCGFELHSCKQCTHFDPASRYECTEAIPERIADKGARNECSFFALRVRVEKDTSPGKARPASARQAFENLFKK